jgi:hypothetical protein
VTDGTGVAAPAISQQVGPPCDGVVGTEKLPVVEGRPAAFEILRSAWSVDRDTRGGYLITWVGAASLALRHPELFSLRCAFDSLGSSFPIIPVPACPEHTRRCRLRGPSFGVRSTSARPDWRSGLSGIDSSG